MVVALCFEATRCWIGICVFLGFESGFWSIWQHTVSNRWKKTKSMDLGSIVLCSTFEPQSVCHQWVLLYAYQYEYRIVVFLHKDFSLLFDFLQNIYLNLCQYSNSSTFGTHNARNRKTCSDSRRLKHSSGNTGSGRCKPKIYSQRCAVIQDISSTKTSKSFSQFQLYEFNPKYSRTIWKSFHPIITSYLRSPSGPLTSQRLKSPIEATRQTKLLVL